MNILQPNGKVRRTQMTIPTQDLFLNQYEPDNLDLTAAQRFCNYSHQTLREDLDAMEALESLGIDDFNLIDHFSLGFANGSYLKQLPHRDSFEGAYERGTLQRLGITNDIGRFNFPKSIVIPVVLDINSLFYGVITYWLYPKTKELRSRSIIWSQNGLALFNKQAADYYEHLNVTSSPLTALKFIQAGYDNTIAIVSNGATEDSYYDLIHRYPTKKISIIADSSIDDEIFRVQLKSACLSLGISIKEFMNE
ncbi:MAG: hypothetical protein HWE16_02560 [Gammaproteobacteria bacterium]|nr:hypothetical protein [Gammaproteobacteria bacterium]